jgi:polyhydroxybutyrate depolymerase
VVALHYYTGTGRAEAEQTLFSPKADAEGFLVAYPDGAVPREPGFSWSFGHRWPEGGPDDVAFVGEVIRHVSSQYAVDPKRIYVTGMSQGGMLAHVVGCELSDTVAAIAPVGAALMTEPTSEDSISVLIVHGSEDPALPYEGRRPEEVTDGGFPFPSVADAAAIWADHNGCSRPPKKTQDGLVTREVYTGGRGSTEVAVYTIIGGRHDWPGDNNDETGAGLIGADAIWEFFEAHPKVSAGGAQATSGE